MNVETREERGIGWRLWQGFFNQGFNMGFNMDQR